MTVDEKWNAVKYLCKNDGALIHMYLGFHTIDQLFDLLAYKEYRRKRQEFLTPIYSRDSKGRFKSNNK